MRQSVSIYTQAVLHQDGIRGDIMKKFIVMLIILSGFLSDSFLNAQSIELTDSEDIKYAHAVNEAMGGVSNKVMGCINEGGTKEECLCSECSCKFTAEYEAFKKAYKDALAANPGWDGEAIFYRLEGDPTGYSLNFAALKRQFSGECP